MKFKTEFSTEISFNSFKTISIHLFLVKFSEVNLIVSSKLQRFIEFSLKLFLFTSYIIFFLKRQQVIQLINFFFLSYPLRKKTIVSKHNQKVSLIGNNASTKPQIVKTPVQVESQFDKKERGKAFRQVLAAFIVNIGTVNTGLIFGWSAVAIPQLMKADSLITIDKNQSSWIGELKN